MATTEKSGEAPPDTRVIHIDRKSYKAPTTTLIGTELRALSNPAIGPERDLWQEIPGGDDHLVENHEVVQLRNGMHFYSAPATINPG